MSIFAGAFLSVGFRPFYLGAAIFACLAMPAWFAAYWGWTTVGAGLAGIAWHAHEMLFGFAPAVMAGFLLTAVRNWTGQPMPAGVPLAALFGLWLFGRIGLLTGPADVALIIDVAFLPTLAVVLAIPLWQSRNYRNFLVPAVLLVLAGSNLAYHLAFAASSLAVNWLHAVRVAADVIIVLMVVIGGRVIPAFSRNAIAGLKPRIWPTLEVLAIAGVVLIVLVDLCSSFWRPPPGAFRALLFVTAALHLTRMAAWQPWAMRKNLLLAVLPLSYAWIPIHLLLRGALAADALHMPPLALHALVIGAMAGLMLAMMTRSALGHTARPLTARRPEAAIFLAIHAAAVVRALLPLVWPGYQLIFTGIAGALWTLAFGVFAFAYWPILTAPPADAPGCRR